jgi:hypothetical protein
MAARPCFAELISVNKDVPRVGQWLGELALVICLGHGGILAEGVAGPGVDFTQVNVDAFATGVDGCGCAEQIAQLFATDLKHDGNPAIGEMMHQPIAQVFR